MGRFSSCSSRLSSLGVSRSRGRPRPPRRGRRASSSFYSERDGNAEIYVMNHDGPGLVRLTKNASNEFSPDWSPDGTRIVFESDRDGRELDVYATSLDGRAVRRLTNAPGYDYEAVWQR